MAVINILIQCRMSEVYFLKLHIIIIITFIGRGESVKRCKVEQYERLRINNIDSVATFTCYSEWVWWEIGGVRGEEKTLRLGWCKADFHVTFHYHNRLKRDKESKRGRCGIGCIRSALCASFNLQSTRRARYQPGGCPPAWSFFSIVFSPSLSIRGGLDITPSNINPWMKMHMVWSRCFTKMYIPKLDTFLLF